MELKTKLSFYRAKLGEGYFYPFAQRGSYLIGLTTDKDLAIPESISYEYHRGMSGCSDEQMAIKVEDYPELIKLPHAWHYTMSGYLEGVALYIAEPKQTEIPSTAWEETRLLKVHPLIARAMAVLSRLKYPYAPLEPIEHGIPHRKQFEWSPPNLNLRFNLQIWLNDPPVEAKIIQNPLLRSKAYLDIPTLIKGEFKYRHMTPDSSYLQFYDEQDVLVAQVFLRRCAVTGRQIVAGLVLREEVCHGFEQDQPVCQIRGGKNFFLQWNWFDEKERLGDLVFTDSCTFNLFKDSLEPIKAPWDELLKNEKLSYVGNDSGGILYHEEHGGIRVTSTKKPYRLIYEQAVD